MLFNKDEQSKIKKLHDSLKDSDALAKLAYEFGQMGSYFDRANSPRSREILGKEDETKYKEFVRKAIQVKAQLQKDLAGMKKGMTQEQKLGWYKTDKNKTIRLLEDGISRLSWISYDMHDNTGKKLADELKQLLKEYEMLLEEGPKAFDSKARDADGKALLQETKSWYKELEKWAKSQGTWDSSIYNNDLWDLFKDEENLDEISDGMYDTVDYVKKENPSLARKGEIILRKIDKYLGF